MVNDRSIHGRADRTGVLQADDVVHVAAARTRTNLVFPYFERMTLTNVAARSESYCWSITGSTIRHGRITRAHDSTSDHCDRCVIETVT